MEKFPTKSQLLLSISTFFRTFAEIRRLAGVPRSPFSLGRMDDGFHSTALI